MYILPVDNPVSQSQEAKRARARSREHSQHSFDSELEAAVVIDAVTYSDPDQRNKKENGQKEDDGSPDIANHNVQHEHLNRPAEYDKSGDEVVKAKGLSITA